jgi:hypothetical protein
LLDTVNSIQAVDKGEIDFTLLDSDMAIWVTRYQFKNAMVAFPVGPTDDIGWAFRKQDTDRQTAVQAFFDSQKASASSPLKVRRCSCSAMPTGDAMAQRTEKAFQILVCYVKIWLSSRSPWRMESGGHHGKVLPTWRRGVTSRASMPGAGRRP